LLDNKKKRKRKQKKTIKQPIAPYFAASTAPDLRTGAK